MGQIIQNYLFIAALPFLLTAGGRLLCRRTGRGYLLTLTAAVLAAVGWILYRAVPSHGSELYGIIALMASSAAAGTLLTGLLLRLRRAR